MTKKKDEWEALAYLLANLIEKYALTLAVDLLPQSGKVVSFNPKPQQFDSPIESDEAA